jgi:hypothetical protein
MQLYLVIAFKEPLDPSFKCMVFGTLSTPPIEAPFGPQSQNINKCVPLYPTFSIYIHES